MEIKKTAEQYIDSLVDQGYTTPTKIVDEVTNRLLKVNEDLAKLNDLREEKYLLLEVLKSYKKDVSKFSSRNKIFEEVLPVKTDKEISDKIVEIVRNTSFISIMKKEILIIVCYDNKDPSPVYIAIRDLLKKGILKQNEDRTISKGDCWIDG